MPTITLVEDFVDLLGNNFVFQKTVHMALVIQHLFGEHCLDLKDKVSWLPNSPDLMSF